MFFSSKEEGHPGTCFCLEGLTLPGLFGGYVLRRHLQEILHVGEGKTLMLLNWIGWIFVFHGILHIFIWVAYVVTLTFRTKLSGRCCLARSSWGFRGFRVWHESATGAGVHLLLGKTHTVLPVRFGRRLAENFKALGQKFSIDQW